MRRWGERLMAGGGGQLGRFALSEDSRWPIWFCAALWVGLWFSINTGPWRLEEMPVTAMEWAHYLRTLFPAIPLLFFGVVRWRTRARWPMPRTLWWWSWYGVVGVLSSAVSERPPHALYWALLYLSVLGAAWAFMQGPNPLTRAKWFNVLSWLTTAGFLGAMLFLAREALFGSEGDLYGAYGLQSEVAGMPMSRSSGLARFATVPGLVSLVMLFYGPLWSRLVFGVVGIASAVFIYQLQSRGAIFGLAVTLVFLLFAVAGRARSLVLMGLVLAVFAVVTDVVPQRVQEQVVEHLSRGQSREEFASMTGRTRAWELALHVVWQSPLFGHGPQADRFLTREHVHNTYLYALLQGGFVGLGLFLVGFAVMWWWILRVLYTPWAGRVEGYAVWLMCASILTFFTVRSVTEVCGPLFAVDLMVMVPAIAYVEAFGQKVSLLRAAARQQRSVRTASAMRGSRIGEQLIPVSRFST